VLPGSIRRQPEVVAVRLARRTRVENLAHTGVTTRSFETAEHPQLSIVNGRAVGEEHTQRIGALRGHRSFNRKDDYIVAVGEQPLSDRAGAIGIRPALDEPKRFRVVPSGDGLCEGHVIGRP
jgi:hypothetical protein